MFKIHAKCIMISEKALEEFSNHLGIKDVPLLFPFESF